MSLKNIRIEAKIAGIFIILAILIMGFVAYTINSLHVIDDRTHEAMHHHEDNGFLVQKKIDHLQWAEAVSDLFLRQEVGKLNVQTDHT